MFQLHDPEPPDPATLDVDAVLLASEGKPLTPEAIDFAARIAQRSNAPVRVLTIARIWGTSFGFPAPGLLPTRAEWKEQHDIVEKAIKALKRRGVEASGHVLGTRKPTKKILAEARRHICDAIVMPAEPPRNRFVGNFMWSQEAYRVRRKADVPVYVIQHSPE
jgi:nucleotide-binding universal stress UspA family protein